MNKENLVNYVKKNKWSILSGIGFLIGGYFLLHTNFSYHLEDRTGKYILNPEYKEFHKYEWTDLKSVYPTKLAYDPAWFKLPPDKYIPKEQPIPKNISNISDPIIRRQAYFNFLCKTESVLFISKSYYDKSRIYSIYSNEEEGLLNLTITLNIPKTINNLDNSSIYSSSEQKSVMFYANNNPFINPNLQDFFNPLIEGHRYNFSGVDIDLNPKSLNSPPQKSINNQFIELMSPDGKIFKIEFDVKINSFLPAKIINKSSARYYILNKTIENDNLKNLGIYGFEHIIFDRKTNIIVNYSRNFYIGALLPWEERISISNFSWVKKDYCNTKVNIVDKII